MGRVCVADDSSQTCDEIHEPLLSVYIIFMGVISKMSEILPAGMSNQECRILSEQVLKWLNVVNIDILTCIKKPKQLFPFRIYVKVEIELSVANALLDLEQADEFFCFVFC